MSTQDSDALFNQVCAILERAAGPGRTPLQVDSNTRLSDGYWFDSMELLEVVLACEQQFGVTFEPSLDLTPEALATVGSLVRLVRSRLVGTAT